MTQDRIAINENAVDREIVITRVFDAPRARVTCDVPCGTAPGIFRTHAAD
jgi:hypothetical protein